MKLKHNYIKTKLIFTNAITIKVVFLISSRAILGVVRQDDIRDFGVKNYKKYKNKTKSN